MRRFPWHLLLLLVFGAALGLLYAWVLSPVKYVDTTPDSLRGDFKDRFRSSIAAAYAATGNLERARARLNQLGDPDSVEALNAQAQRMLAAGNPYGSVEQVAQLAVDLQNGSVAAQPPTLTPQQPASTVILPPLEDTGTPPLPGLTETVIPDQVIQAPATSASPTARPTRTSTPGPGRPFEMVAQDTKCDPSLPEGLLQVLVNDSRRRPVPGVEIIAAWDGGEEHFFTGLKPELGNGYADFLMQPEVMYSVRIADGGTPVPGVIAPSCSADDGTVTTGQIQLTFQRR